MKTTLFVLLTLALGVAAGVGIATWRLGDSPWASDATVETPGPIAADVPIASPNSANSAPISTAAPKAVAKATEFDFGVAVQKAEGSHTFTLANEGNAPLKVTPGDPSSIVVTTSVDKEIVEPGQSTAVTVAWKSAVPADPFRETATVVTNDPEQRDVAFTIFGRIAPPLLAVPDKLVFRPVAMDGSSTLSAYLVCFVDERLKILDYSLSDSSAAKSFSVSFEPMVAEDLKKVLSAKSGLVVKVAMKPGMAPGDFRQQIVMKTNLTSPKEFALPIQGTVVSDVALGGPGWNEDSHTLSLGSVSGKSGYQVRLYIVVRGAHRKEIVFKPTIVEPSLLKVSLGERSELNNGTVVKIPLLIEVPPGSDSVNYLGMAQGRTGEIVLETNHPQIPKLRFAVQLAVEN